MKSSFGELILLHSVLVSLLSEEACRVADENIYWFWTEFVVPEMCSYMGSSAQVETRWTIKLVRIWALVRSYNKMRGLVKWFDSNKEWGVFLFTFAILRWRETCRTFVSRLVISAATIQGDLWLPLPPTRLDVIYNYDNNYGCSGLL